MKVVKDIMAARVQKAAGMKCDGIEPDNMMVRSLVTTAVSVPHQTFSSCNIPGYQVPYCRQERFVG